PPRRAGHPGHRRPAGSGLGARARRELRRAQHGSRPAREGVPPAAPRGPAMRRAGARVALAGVATLLLLALAGAVAPWLAPAGPYAADLTGRLGTPSDAHLFGQDTLGRDVLARVLYGARISLGVGAATVVLSLAAGTLLGCVAGYAGGWVDEGLARVIDVLLAFPGLLLAIALAALRGPSLPNVVLALSVLGWTGYARLARAAVMTLRRREFVAAAPAPGAPPGRTLPRHLPPPAAPTLPVPAS